VFGNGDIWEAHDAQRMLRETGCAGVIIGRGCLGRPWLFAELALLLGGGQPSEPPRWGVIEKIVLEHATAMVEWSGAEHEHAVLRAFRKHAGWYTKGFRASAVLREQLMHTQTLAQLESMLAQIDVDEAFPEHALRAVRGKRGRLARIVLPHGYLDELDDDCPPDPEAESLSSGG
jgi:tRNA-dihydrouridine synthase